MSDSFHPCTLTKILLKGTVIKSHLFIMKSKTKSLFFRFHSTSMVWSDVACSIAEDLFTYETTFKTKMNYCQRNEGSGDTPQSRLF